MKYEAVIGIETHVQLATKSKLFCGCNNDSREAKPNTYVCPVCIALPGALPVLNGQAVKLALKAGLALRAYPEMKDFHTKFDRKNYFYPDNPSGYQITQFDGPIISQGYVEFPVQGKTKRVGITRAHLEADAGKLTHPAGKDYSLVDLNRAGTPLLEIVSEPDMRSAAEAKAYAEELYHLMRYAEVSDCDLYYGNMRFDVNVSLRPEGGQKLGVRTESKNLNSFRAVAGVVEYEIKRQAEILEKGEQVLQETRGWNEDKGVTFSQRAKEEAHDYRYFPEPDLPPLVITERMLAQAKSEMPEMMPNDIRKELNEMGFPANDTELIVEDPSLRNLYVKAHDLVRPDQYHRISKWLTSEFRSIAAADPDFDRNKLKITPENLAKLAVMVDAAELSLTNAKKTYRNMLMQGGDPKEIAEKEGFLQKSDAGEIESWVDQAIADNPKPAEDYKNGEAKALGFLVGQVMKLSKGQANPPMVNDILKSKLKK